MVVKAQGPSARLGGDGRAFHASDAAAVGSTLFLRKQDMCRALVGRAPAAKSRGEKQERASVTTH